MQTDKEIRNTDSNSDADERVFTSLFYAYKDKLYSYILRLTHSEQEAEDVVQEVFLKLWNNRNTLSEIDNMNAYLFRTAKNHIIDESRRFIRDVLMASQELSDEDGVELTTPIDKMLSEEMSKKLEIAISQLPDRQKDVFLMHNELGLSYEEIAKKLNISIFTVHNHMKRALKGLRAYLSKNYPEIYIIFLACIL